MTKKTESTKHTGIRLPILTFHAVVKRAEKEGRSLSNMIIWLIQQSLTKK